MYGLFWFVGLAGLLLLHFAVLPRLAGAVANVSPNATRVPNEVARRYFLFWSGCIAVFTAIFFMASVVVWNRAGYLGTLFLVVASGLWLFRSLSGGRPNEDDSQGFELSIVSTLAGSVLGTAVGWGISRVF